MLRFFSRFKGLHKAVFVVFCGILLIGLIVSYAIPSTDLTSRGGLTGSNPNDSQVVVKVGDRAVTLKEFRAQLQALGQVYSQGRELPLAVVKAMGLEQQALDALITDRLSLSEADRLQFGATDQEVSEEIRKMPGFSDEKGNFIGAEEYRRALALRGQDIEEFEDGIRRSLATAKIREYLGAPAQVSDKEAEEEFVKNNTQIDLVYAQIAPGDVRDAYKPAEEDLKSYYDGHKDEFKTTETVRKVEYIFVPTDAATKTVPVTEDEIKKAYEERKQFEPRVSLIKLNVLTPTDEETVSKKINDLNVRVRGAENKPAEDFATVARGNSQDPSAAKGGDIGFIKKDPNKAGDWKQRAHNLKVGDIDGPFRDGTSWYIMKIMEQRQVTIAEMRPTLVASLQNSKGFIRANELADKAYELFTANKDIDKTIQEITKELKVTPESMKRTLQFFKKGDTLPEIGSNPSFEGAIETLNKNDIGAKVSIPNGIAVPRLLDMKEPNQQLSYDDAKFQVEQKLRTVKEPDIVKAKAQEIIGKAKTAADLEGLFKAAKLDVKKDTNFNSFSFSTVQVLNRTRSASMDLKEGEVSKNPIKIGVNWLVFGALKRKDPDMSRLATERAGVRSSLTSEAQSRLFDAHMRAARKRYETEGKLVIYQDRIDNFFNSATVNPADQAAQK
ncbi:MAG: SurA N-terminal domain-containing protein [Blastocatellia bacterium]